MDSNSERNQNLNAEELELGNAPPSDIEQSDDGSANDSEGYLADDESTVDEIADCEKLLDEIQMKLDFIEQIYEQMGISQYLEEGYISPMVPSAPPSSPIQQFQMRVPSPPPSIEYAQIDEGTFMEVYMDEDSFFEVYTDEDEF